MNRINNSVCNGHIPFGCPDSSAINYMCEILECPPTNPNCTPSQCRQCGGVVNCCEDMSLCVYGGDYEVRSQETSQPVNPDIDPMNDEWWVDVCCPVEDLYIYEHAGGEYCINSGWLGHLHFPRCLEEFDYDGNGVINAFDASRWNRYSARPDISDFISSMSTGAPGPVNWNFHNMNIDNLNTPCDELGINPAPISEFSNLNFHSVCPPPPPMNPNPTSGNRDRTVGVPPPPPSYGDTLVDCSQCSCGSPEILDNGEINNPIECNAPSSACGSAIHCADDLQPECPSQNIIDNCGFCCDNSGQPPVGMPYAGSPNADGTPNSSCPDSWEDWVNEGTSRMCGCGDQGCGCNQPDMQEYFLDLDNDGFGYANYGSWRFCQSDVTDDTWNGYISGTPTDSASDAHRCLNSGYDNYVCCVEPVLCCYDDCNQACTFNNCSQCQPKFFNYTDLAGDIHQINLSNLLVDDNFCASATSTIVSTDDYNNTYYTFYNDYIYLNNYNEPFTSPILKVEYNFAQGDFSSSPSNPQNGEHKIGIMKTIDGVPYYHYMSLSTDVTNDQYMVEINQLELYDWIISSVGGVYPWDFFGTYYVYYGIPTNVSPSLENCLENYMENNDSGCGMYHTTSFEIQGAEYGCMDSEAICNYNEEATHPLWVDWDIALDNCVYPKQACGDWDGDGYPCCTVEVDIACPDGNGTFDGYSGPHEEYPWPSNNSTQWIPVENGGMGDIPTITYGGSEVRVGLDISDVGSIAHNVFCLDKGYWNTRLPDNIDLSDFFEDCNEPCMYWSLVEPPPWHYLDLSDKVNGYVDGAWEYEANCTSQCLKQAYCSTHDYMDCSICEGQTDIEGPGGNQGVNSCWNPFSNPDNETQWSGYDDCGSVADPQCMSLDDVILMADGSELSIGNWLNYYFPILTGISITQVHNDGLELNIGNGTYYKKALNNPCPTNQIVTGKFYNSGCGSCTLPGSPNNNGGSVECYGLGGQTGFGHKSDCLLILDEGVCNVNPNCNWSDTFQMCQNVGQNPSDIDVIPFYYTNYWYEDREWDLGSWNNINNFDNSIIPIGGMNFLNQYMPQMWVDLNGTELNQFGSPQTCKGTCGGFGIRMCSRSSGEENLYGRTTWGSYYGPHVVIKDRENDEVLWSGFLESEEISGNCPTDGSADVYFGMEELSSDSGWANIPGLRALEVWWDNDSYSAGNWDRNMRIQGFVWNGQLLSEDWPNDNLESKLHIFRTDVDLGCNLQPCCVSDNNYNNPISYNTSTCSNTNTGGQAVHPGDNTDIPCKIHYYLSPYVFTTEDIGQSFYQYHFGSTDLSLSEIIDGINDTYNFSNERSKGAISCTHNSDCMIPSSNGSLGDYYNHDGGNYMLGSCEYNWYNQRANCCCNFNYGCLKTTAPNFNDGCDGDCTKDCVGVLHSDCLTLLTTAPIENLDNIDNTTTDFRVSSSYHSGQFPSSLTEIMRFHRSDTGSTEYVKFIKRWFDDNGYEWIRVQRGLFGTTSFSADVREAEFNPLIDNCNHDCCLDVPYHTCTDPDAINYYCYGDDKNYNIDYALCPLGVLPNHIKPCTGNLAGEFGSGQINNCGYEKLKPPVEGDWLPQVNLIEQNGMIGNFQAQKVEQDWSLDENKNSNIVIKTLDSHLSDSDNKWVSNWEEQYGEGNYSVKVESINDSPVQGLNKALHVEIYDQRQDPNGKGGIYTKNISSTSDDVYFQAWVKVIQGELEFGYLGGKQIRQGVTDGWKLVNSTQYPDNGNSIEMDNVILYPNAQNEINQAEVYILTMEQFTADKVSQFTQDTENCCCEYRTTCGLEIITPSNWEFNNQSGQYYHTLPTNIDDCGMCNYSEDLNQDNQGCGCFLGEPPQWYYDGEGAGGDYDGYGCSTAGLLLEYEDTDPEQEDLGDDIQGYYGDIGWQYCRPSQGGVVPSGYIYVNMPSQEVWWMPSCSSDEDCVDIGTGFCIDGQCEHPGWLGTESASNCSCPHNYVDCAFDNVDGAWNNSSYCSGQEACQCLDPDLLPDVLVNNNGYDSCGVCHGQAIATGNHISGCGIDSEHCIPQDITDTCSFVPTECGGGDNCTDSGEIYWSISVNGYDCNCDCCTEEQAAAGECAYIDECGYCVGGNTNYEQNFAKDDCGVCNGWSKISSEPSQVTYHEKMATYYPSNEGIWCNHGDVFEGKEWQSIDPGVGNDVQPWWVANGTQSALGCDCTCSPMLMGGNYPDGWPGEGFNLYYYDSTTMTEEQEEYLLDKAWGPMSIINNFFDGHNRIGSDGDEYSPMSLISGENPVQKQLAVAENCIEYACAIDQCGSCGGVNYRVPTFKEVNENSDWQSYQDKIGQHTTNAVPDHYEYDYVDASNVFYSDPKGAVDCVDYGWTVETQLNYANQLSSHGMCYAKLKLLISMLFPGVSWPLIMGAEPPSNTEIFLDFTPYFEDLGQNYWLGDGLEMFASEGPEFYDGAQGGNSYKPALFCCTSEGGISFPYNNTSSHPMWIAGDGSLESVPGSNFLGEIPQDFNYTWYPIDECECGYDENGLPRECTGSNINTSGTKMCDPNYCYMMPRKEFPGDGFRPFTGEFFMGPSIGCDGTCSIHGDVPGFDECGLCDGNGRTCGSSADNYIGEQCDYCPNPPKDWRDLTNTEQPYVGDCVYDCGRPLWETQKGFEYHFNQSGAGLNFGQQSGPDFGPSSDVSMDDITFSPHNYIPHYLSCVRKDRIDLLFESPTLVSGDGTEGNWSQAEGESPDGDTEYLRHNTWMTDTKFLVDSSLSLSSNTYQSPDGQNWCQAQSGQTNECNDYEFHSRLCEDTDAGHGWVCNQGGFGHRDNLGSSINFGYDKSSRSHCLRSEDAFQYGAFTFEGFKETITPNPMIYDSQNLSNNVGYERYKESSAQCRLRVAEYKPNLNCVEHQYSNCTCQNFVDQYGNKKVFPPGATQIFNATESYWVSDIAYEYYYWLVYHLYQEVYAESDFESDDVEPLLGTSMQFTPTYTFNNVPYPQGYTYYNRDTGYYHNPCFTQSGGIVPNCNIYTMNYFVLDNTCVPVDVSYGGGYDGHDDPYYGDYESYYDNWGPDDMYWDTFDWDHDWDPYEGMEWDYYEENWGYEPYEGGSPYIDSDPWNNMPPGMDAPIDWMNPFDVSYT